MESRKTSIPKTKLKQLLKEVAGPTRASIHHILVIKKGEAGDKEPSRSRRSSYFRCLNAQETSMPELPTHGKQLELHEGEVLKKSIPMFSVSSKASRQPKGARAASPLEQAPEPVQNR